MARDLGIRQLFGGSTDALWPTWERCGFEYLGVSYRFSSLNDSLHRLMLMDIDTAVSGSGASPAFREMLARGSTASQVAGAGD